MFDIRDGQNCYRHCPRCKAEIGMGLVNRKGMAVAVQCMMCDLRGPEVAFDPNTPLAADKPAFDAWNALSRS